MVYEIALPKNSLIENALSKIDYEDTFGVTMDELNLPLHSLPPLLFSSLPDWFALLFKLREKLAGLVGLKTGNQEEFEKMKSEFKGKPGEQLSIFKVYDRNEEELLMGENDKHLDFRLSFFIKEKGDQTELLLSTTVQYNAVSGKLYFFFVKPFHRLIVPILLKRMVLKIQRNGK